MDELKKEMIGFWKKIGRLLAGGVPILQTLKVIQEESKNARLKEAVGAIRISVENGSSFSESLAKEPSLFPLSVRTLIKSGEVTGRLDAVFSEVAQGLEEGSFEIGSGAGTDEITNMVPSAEETVPPAIHLVNKIILQAVERRASDIHLEHFGDKLVVRYRIDGVLHPVDCPIMANAIENVISRIKIMANMVTTQKRLPQDGRIQLNVKGHPMDLRVSCVPYVTGECLVLRVLDAKTTGLSLDKAGVTGANLAQLRRWLNRPHGLIIVSGPTGSGKTTTLYSILHELNKPGLKITTVEDPVEYLIEGICQQQVQPQVGITFATALRAQYRQDPDVLMVGELRDLDTANLCIHAALTGHLVLTVFHTNDASQGVRRLLDMGVDPFLVNATLIGIMAQRLVRKICPACRHEVQPPEWISELTHSRPGMRFYEGQGCEQCQQTRYRGRIVINELLDMNDELKKLVSRDADAATLRKAAIGSGMIPLKEDGLLKAAEGITTVEEVLRVCGGM